MIGEPPPVKRNRHPERISLVSVPGIRCTKCGRQWARRKGTDVKVCIDQCPNPECKTQTRDCLVPTEVYAYHCGRCHLTWRQYLHVTKKDYAECRKCKARRAVDPGTGGFV